MTAKVMLVPNPHRSGAIDRVIVIGKSDDQQRLIVLNIGALDKSPKLLKRFNAGYYYATRFWDTISSLVIIGGIVLSFIWHWWAFLAGMAVAVVVYRATRQSVADFAQRFTE
ncbi:MAG: hypothetical protein WA459_25570 [Stellaceae bacterium]